MKLNPNITAREHNLVVQPGRARRSARAAQDAPAPERRAQSDAPYRRLVSLRSFVSIVISFLFAGAAAHAQVNSGSNGSDGVFNPTTNIVINMADHPNGIYQYTSVNIPTSVTVTFIPNANNMPVVWLVQSNVAINGIVDVSGKGRSGIVPGQGGPGGGAGGYGGQGGSWIAHRGAGRGGGDPAQENATLYGGGGSYATFGGISGSDVASAGGTYGNKYLLPLLGGSGGGGGYQSGGGGGGGAVLIVSDTSIVIDGVVVAAGGVGGGSGGGIRLVAPALEGVGRLFTPGGWGGFLYGGDGFVRLDSLADNFHGTIGQAVGSRGFNPVLIPPTTSGTLKIQSVGGVPVSASPSGQLSTPDAVLSAQQNNPISIVVHCSNIALNTQITVSVKPANGPAVSATGLNNTGTLASSTATVSINMPRGGGLIYATAATGN